MNLTAYTYLFYVAITVGITIWVARTLRKYGVVFLTKSDGPNPLADAFTHLLIVGFYLINFGIISFALKTDHAVNDSQVAIELLSSKVGIILVTLGAMHFCTMALFASFGKKDDHGLSPAIATHWPTT